MIEYNVGYTYNVVSTDMSNINCFYSGGMEIVCRIQLEFEKMNLWKMRCAGSNVMYLKVVHYLNIVSVNITKNRVCVVKRNLKLQELKNVNFKEGVRNVTN